MSDTLAVSLGDLVVFMKRFGSPISSRELAPEVELTPSECAKTLHLMEKRGLVELDARGFWVLTADGEAVKPETLADVTIQTAKPAQRDDHDEEPAPIAQPPKRRGRPPKAAAQAATCSPFQAPAPIAQPEQAPEPSFGFVIEDGVPQGVGADRLREIAAAMTHPTDDSIRAALKTLRDYFSPDSLEWPAVETLARAALREPPKDDYDEYLSSIGPRSDGHSQAPELDQVQEDPTPNDAGLAEDLRVLREFIGGGYDDEASIIEANDAVDRIALREKRDAEPVAWPHALMLQDADYISRIANEGLDSERGWYLYGISTRIRAQASQSAAPEGKSE